MLDKKTIQQLKENKDAITPELLDVLRSKGNEGKQIALDILDTEKDKEQYYLDAFGGKISFDGNRRLKKAFTKMNLSQIHIDEIMRCAEDIHYFKDNYIKIKTKEGITFPELRQYQEDFINTIIPDENEDVVGLMGRQCCTPNTKLTVRHNNVVEDVTFEQLFNQCKDDHAKDC